MDDFFKAIDASTEEYMETYKAELDKRRAEKLRLEEQQRKEGMDKLRRDMEKSRGDTVVLSTGLKDKEAKGRTRMDEEEEEEEEVDLIDEDDDDDDYDRSSEDDDVIGEDEDEQVGGFSFK
ncbi:hypothetical protein Dsin_030293 [Dipteronia sinensis]|uniref:Uncharacterized protein n=1 Tax=Dipteronia sinensis TaxID=43782 RepID=A0AAD9ZJA9_9ROSI|nr:hypothetical protein Dsin_030293 [Dipteronia sinensis]